MSLAFVHVFEQFSIWLGFRDLEPVGSTWGVELERHLMTFTVMQQNAVRVEENANR